MAVDDKNPLWWNGKQYAKFLIIENHDIHTGFCAFIIFVLNGIRKAISINAIPVLDFNKHNTPYLWDEHKGDFIWEYFFEPFYPVDINTVRALLETGQLKENLVEILSPNEFGYLHHHDPDRLATFWAWDAPQDKVTWMQEKRTLGREFINKYVQPKSHILEKVEHFCSQHFTRTVIGVHIRGTDFNYATPIAIDTYFTELEKIIAKLHDYNIGIFIATDQQQYLACFHERYGDRVLARDVTRSSNHIAPVKFDDVSGYQKGEEALVDMLILSRCQHVIKGPGALGEMSLWFGTHHKITDLAIHCDFNTKHYSQMTSAYAVFNIGKLTSLQLIGHKLKTSFIRLLFSFRIVAYFYKRFKQVRHWLMH
ncbi:MAG: hypothetical protein GJ680_11370 [Alteromonadaceae bacterium]|nr:hypothetical protein [Alteromonadaceae bacterium]